MRGNGQIDPSESCDGSLLNNATCTLLGFGAGNLACSSSCQFDVSACTGGTITPTVVASRTSCTAPCTVSFDATSTSGLSGSDYVGASWNWAFNDPTSPQLGTIGFVAAHVFDNPGTYTVTTRVHDLAGNAGSASTTITVSAMSGTTYYVSAAGSDTDTGLSMTHAFQTLVARTVRCRDGNEQSSILMVTPRRLRSRSTLSTEARRRSTSRGRSWWAPTPTPVRHRQRRRP